MPEHSGRIYNLLSQTDRHPKIVKSLKRGVITGIMHLAPAKSSGFNVCQKASRGCEAACLNYAGKQWPGRNCKQAARIRRTKFFFEDRTAFMEMLAREIANRERAAEKADAICGIRLNGTSDIPWERVRFRNHENIMEAFPNVKFYDYTKHPDRHSLPENYRLTFSRSESNEDDCVEAYKNGMNIAIVFEENLPSRWNVGHWHNIRVIDGDEHDFRYADYDEFLESVIVGLRSKGQKAKADQTGFIVRR